MRFVWTQQGIGLAPHPIFGLVLQAGDAEKFPRAFVSKAWILLRVSEQNPCVTAIEEDGGDKRLVELEPACEADGVAPPYPV